MLARRGLPRTLRGIGGIRLIDMPGVIYPDSVLHAAKGTDQASGKPYSSPPSWGITSREAAVMLGISVRSARALLNRSNVNFRLVAPPGSYSRLYWDRRVVERLLTKRMPLVRQVPARLCTAREACCILMIARSTLYRYVKNGVLKEFKVRLATSSGVRVVSYYVRADVRLLAARQRAAQARAEQRRREAYQSEWKEQNKRFVSPAQPANS